MKVKDLPEGLYGRVVIPFRDGGITYVFTNVRVVKAQQQKYLLKPSDYEKNKCFASYGEGSVVSEVSMMSLIK